LHNFKKNIRKLLNYVTGWRPFRRNIPPTNDVNRILVISLYFRGDFLFQTAFFEALKLIYPNSKMDLWIKSRLTDIIFNDPRFNKIHVFDDIKTADYGESTKFNLRGKLDFLKKIRKSKYDIIIDLTGKYSTALFTLFSSSKYSAGINYNFFGFCYDKFIELNTATVQGHLIDKFLFVIPGALNLDEIEWGMIKEHFKTKPYIYIDDEVKKFIDQKLKSFNNGRPLVTIHTTSGWKAKEMDSEIFAQVVKYISAKEYNYIFIGDEVDRKKLEEIKSFLKEDDINIDESFIGLSFIQSAELIRRSDLFIGSDSAPLHVAGAVGTPSIGIFGPTNPEFSKPAGDIHEIIYNRLSCSASDERQYCTRNAGKTCKTLDCMKLITINDVIDKITKILLFENTFVKCHRKASK
jgi:ADP-heptose:LPS heptosyltransferase